MASRPWYADAFGAEYLRVYAHRSPGQARAQVRAMQDAGLLPRAGRVLDIACGAGRHLHAMREAGLRVHGLDYSTDLLRAGNLAGHAVRADMRAIPFTDASFDWACSLFTAFGYFESVRDDEQMFEGAARALKPGGCFVVDHINPAITLRQLRPESIEVRDGMKITQRRRHDAALGVIIKDVSVENAGVTQQWQERVRYYTPETLEKLFTGAGFRILRRCGDLDGRPWDEANSPRQVVLAHRP
jgi:ubiquinone/menaquinone biosynthesis C-methylase UbiE